jgi:hypothetical protein
MFLVWSTTLRDWWHLTIHGESYGTVISFGGGELLHLGDGPRASDENAESLIPICLVL